MIDVLGFAVKRPEIIPTIYWPPLDGWQAIEAKQVRNPDAVQIIWMKPSTWTALANCATREGIFYIPCWEELRTNTQLRQLVEQMEATSATEAS